jgi:hypothetical protein
MHSVNITENADDFDVLGSETTVVFDDLSVIFFDFISS